MYVGWQKVLFDIIAEYLVVEQLYCNSTEENKILLLLIN